MLKMLVENYGGWLLAVVAVALGYLAIRTNAKIEKQRLEFEEKKFKAEEEERSKLAKFREHEYMRFSQPAVDIAEQLANRLIDEPYWAHRALEAAKLMPYRDTLFGERSRHFREEKEELAARFAPALLDRCEALIENGKRHVYLLIDSGTTLFPFFRIIGEETAKLWQRGQRWLSYFHMATNNLPGVEQLIHTGRQTPYGRYSKLAVEDCQLLPGVPLPIFSAVAGDLTKAAIVHLRKQALEKGGEKPPIFIALVVGNWIRVRRTAPPCPVPMARGLEHLGVKQTLVESADEIYVISPLGKIFVYQDHKDVNIALGFVEGSSDPEKAPYDEVKILGEDLARRVKLVSTTRQPTRLLCRHSNRLEDALHSQFINEIDANEFIKSSIEDMPHILLPFNKLPSYWYDEFMTEFPHYHTRTKQDLLRMFSVDLNTLKRENESASCRYSSSV